VNKAILMCFEMNIINSTSLMANEAGFAEAVEIVHHNKIVRNIGIHANFADGPPVSKFLDEKFLDINGNWDIAATKRKIAIFNDFTKKCFYGELKAQVEKVISEGIAITHIDSHLHLHTLPQFAPIFIAVAQEYNLKLRLAQTYNEGNFLKFIFRKTLNRSINNKVLNYSELFETVAHFIKNSVEDRNSLIEIMLHPDIDENGKLTDHYSPTDMSEWLNYLQP
jgi:predicted glycoside hydrolase/deacetylase ChbG (UPF0249 family)